MLSESRNLWVVYGFQIMFSSSPHLELLVVSRDRLRELDLLPLADEGLEERLLVQTNVVGVEVSVEGVRPALLPLEEDVCEKFKNRRVTRVNLKRLLVRVTIPAASSFSLRYFCWLKYFWKDFWMTLAWKSNFFSRASSRRRN